MPVRRGGFGLVELLISISLLTIVLGMVYTAFAQISGHARQLQQTLSEEQNLRLLLRLVADDLMSAQYLQSFTPTESEPYRQSGIEADTERLQGMEFSRIQFHAAVPARFHRGLEEGADPALHELAYWVAQSRDGEDLVLWRREDFYIDNDMKDGGISVPLQKGIETFQVEFLKLREDKTMDVPDEWLPRWKSEAGGENKGLPAALRLTLGVVGGDGKPVRATLVMNLSPSMDVK